MRAKFISESIGDVLKPKSKDEVKQIQSKLHFNEKEALEICAQYIPFINLEFDKFTLSPTASGEHYSGGALGYAKINFSKWCYLNIVNPILKNNYCYPTLILGVIRDTDDEIGIMFYDDSNNSLVTDGGFHSDDIEDGPYPIDIKSFKEDDWNEIIDIFAEEYRFEDCGEDTPDDYTYEKDPNAKFMKYRGFEWDETKKLWIKN